MKESNPYDIPAKFLNPDRPAQQTVSDPLAVLYEIRERDSHPFGPHWVWPDRTKIPHGEDSLVAVYHAFGPDGQEVEVFLSAWPARFYKLKVKESHNSLGDLEPAYDIAFGSGEAPLAALIAQKIATGCLSFRPT